MYKRQILTQLGVDFSHSRHFHGENGAARVTLKDGDRVFLGSNRGGVAKEHPFDFTKEDLDYIKSFQVIYSNTNSYIYDDLSLLEETGDVYKRQATLAGTKAQLSLLRRKN